MNTQRPKDKSEQAGIPNWHDASAYPTDPLPTADPRFREFGRFAGVDVEMLTLALWRWEFLRRLTDYREDWQQRGTATESEKYRLADCFPDPAEARPFPLFFEDMLGFVSREFYFDLSAPIHPQLRFVERYLQRGVAHLKRHGQLKRSKSIFSRQPLQSKWPLLLRALDARAQAATFREIGRILGRQQDYAEAATMGKRIHMRAERLQASLVGKRV